MSYFRANIRAMAGYQPGEQPREVEVLKLNTNENPYPPSARVLDSVRRAASDGLRKYPDPLATEFRERAAAMLGLQPDWILAGNGSDDLLTIITRCFVGEGDLIVAPIPSYILYRSLAEIQGARYLEVPFTESWDLAESFGSAEARLAFLPNPNSPSGTQLSPRRVGEIAARLQGHMPLVVDEAYVDFAPQHCIELVREFDNVIVTRSLSKSYALAGVRFGYAAAPPHLIAGMTKVKDSYNCDSVSIAAAIAALADQDTLHQHVARIKATRSRLISQLRQFGFQVPESQANFVWCTRGPIPARQLFQQLRERRIVVRYMEYQGFGDGVRITVGRDDEIDQLLDAIRQMI